MADMDAVRQALGAAQVNIVGGSYGTRAALEYLRQFPNVVRRAVIDGVAPPDMVLPATIAADGQATLDALFAACAADPACREPYPDLQARWRQVFASLPREITVQHPVTGQVETLTLTAEMAASLLRAPLYAPALAAALPLAVTQAAAGRFEALFGLAGALGGGRRTMQLAEGMHFSVVCAEDLPRLGNAPTPPAPDLGDRFAALYRDACAGWPRGDVPADFYTMPPSSAPVLVLSGGLDPVTPPRHGERAARALGAQARHVVVPNAGHGVMTIGCMRDVLFRFIDAADPKEALAVDTACVESLPRPPAFQPVRPKPDSASRSGS
jgi:pimeloyl-ACP methyl ester carboxylesterase